MKDGYPLWVWIGCTIGNINLGFMVIGWLRARARRRRELAALGLRAAWENEVFGRAE